MTEETCAGCGQSYAGAAIHRLLQLRFLNGQPWHVACMPWNVGWPANGAYPAAREWVTRMKSPAAQALLCQ